MTKQEAVENHRKLWNWIAEQNRLTDKNTDPVTKPLFFEEHDINGRDIPVHYCYACQYASNLTDPDDPGKCDYCPIDWTDNGKLKHERCINNEETGLYDQFSKAVNRHSMRRCAVIAKRIAELPERNP